jgi:flagellar hook protein FlgE
MIVTQQAYTANTRVITTSQQMLTDILNIIR